MLGMRDKQYSEYFDEYEALCDTLFSGDSLTRAELVRLFSEAATADPTGEWNLDHRRIAANVRFYESRKGGFTPSADYTAEQFAEELLGIARAAGKKGFRYLYLRSLFNAADAYRIFARDYERAFACYLEVAAGLDTLSQREFPWKLYMYREIADFYFSFREYKDATVFYRKIAEDPDATYKNNHRLYPALNGLALCYRHAGQYDSSDSCFQRILDLSAPIEEDRYVWEGIAEGSIGYNYYLRGDGDKALAWMKPALAKMKRPNDDAFTSNLAANIADIYLLRGDLPNGEKYLGIALDYHRRTRLPQKDSRLLEVVTRYHTLHGNRSEASACLDSALHAKEREQEAYCGLVLRHVEQRLRAADRLAHERELDTEKLRTTFYKRTAFWISGGLALILMLLALLGIYYRRTRQAYHELVLRSQQWAGIVPTDEPTEECAQEASPAEPEEEDVRPEATITEAPASQEAGNGGKTAVLSEESDRKIMEQIEAAVVSDELYKCPELSLDMLADRTGIYRGYISGALNRCTGRNFNTYINEYRVKEAIRLLSESRNENLTIEAVGYQSGFNDRTNFYRIFKKLTGLSPTDFRKNKSQK